MGYINKPTLVDIRQAGEYATVYRWSLDFSGIMDTLSRPAVVYRGSTAPVTQYQPFDSSLPAQLNALCTTTSLPSKNIDKMIIAIRGHKHYQPGRVTPVGTLNLNFLETINNTTHTLLYRWLNKIWSYNTGIGDVYENTIVDTIRITRLSNNDTPICTYNLFWCFLEDYTPPSLDGSTSGPMTTGLTLSYNDFSITTDLPRSVMPLQPVNMTASYVFR